MLKNHVSERDMALMDEALREARTALAQGGAGVVALLASPDEIIACGRNRSCSCDAWITKDSRGYPWYRVGGAGYLLKRSDIETPTPRDSKNEANSSGLQRIAAQGDNSPNFGKALMSVFL